jgi:hypothetical protein
MFLLDSLLMAPGKAVIAMLEELAKKAQEDFLDDTAVKKELQDIYALLEAGTISEREFDAREVGLLQRLEQIARAKFGGAEGPSDSDPGAYLNGEIVEAGDLPAPATVEEVEMMPAVDVMDAPRLLLEMPAPVARPLVEPQLCAAPPPPPVPPMSIPQYVAPPLQAAAPPPPAPPPAAPAALTMMQVIDNTTRQLGMLKLKVSALTSVARADAGWRVTAEVLERRSVPDTSDLLGVYELQLDEAGNLLRYERTHMRRRADLGR